MKAECTWGEGPDIVVSLDGTPLILSQEPEDLNRFKYGAITKGDFDMTAKEATQFAGELLSAARRAQELDDQAASHDEWKENNGK